MRRVVFVSREKDQFATLALNLNRKMNPKTPDPDTDMEWTATDEDLLALLANTATPDTPAIDLVVISETAGDAKSLVEKIIMAAPMTHCAVASAMDAKAFDDHFEGYGVLMQLPEAPGESEAEKLIQRLDKIAGLAGPAPAGMGETDQ